MSDTMERHIALREAHEIKAEREYFDARPSLHNARLIQMFEAGFRRGFDSGRDVYAALIQPEPTMVAIAESGDLLVRIGDGPWQRFAAGAQVEIVDGQAVEWKETGGGGFRR